MKKIILLILIILLIPFFIITIKDIDREEVNPTLTYNLTTTDSTYTDLNEHTLQEVFESTTPALENLVTNGNFTSGITSWLGGGSFFTFDTSQMKLVADGTEATRQSAQKVSAPSGNIIYIKYSYNVTSYTQGALNTQIADLNDTTTLTQSLKTSVTSGYVTENKTVISTNGGIQINLRAQSTAILTAYWDNILVFNLTASYGVTATSGTAYDNAVAEIEWILSKNDGYIQSVGNPFEIVDLTVEEMDAWYTIYQTYHTTYTTLTLGTATATTYTSLQQLILDNDDKDFKLYRDDVIDETRYRLTQESGYISITNDDDLEIIRINEDDTFESSLQIDDTIDYKLVGYNVTSYIDGSFDNTILAFVWIIPILLIGGFFFIIFSHRKED
jgi:hypothetical protein